MEQALYSLPDGWKWLPFGDLIDLIQNGINGTQNDEKIGVPVSRIETLQNNNLDIKRIKHIEATDSDIKKYKYQDGDLIFSHINSFEKVGKIALYKNQIPNLIHGVNLLRIRLVTDVNPRFIYFYIQSPVFRRLLEPNIKRAINQASINQKNLSNILVPFCESSREQKRIVEKLDALLTRIDTAIKHLQESVTLADALSKNGLSEIFESLKDRYEVVPLSSVVKINSGIALPKLFKNGFSDGDIPFFKVAQMNNHHETMVAPEITFNETVAKEHKIKLFPKGSTLIPKRGGAILTNKKRMLLEDASYDSNIMGLKADESKISDEYLFAFMRTIDLANFVDASTIPQVNNKHIDQMQIPLASIEEQADVVSHVNLLVKKVETMNSEIQRQLDDLQALKSSILDTAFKGEL
ncbi:restriction endonuclease subunit S [Proteus mirabilis]|uniref:restriction endonuclease subunit S n=1 Tax=Proteus mirabilis TaxID=584 RepID=UPI001BAFB21C|nr:restriction endonuclease subunit S [Proteus mirabilis]MBS3842471.1 restriction endonuclease subunit S [Proteus mirabilis]